MARPFMRRRLPFMRHRITTTPYTWDRRSSSTLVFGVATVAAEVAAVDMAVVVAMAVVAMEATADSFPRAPAGTAQMTH